MKLAFDIIYEGTIVTLSQKDSFVEDGVDINVLLFHEFQMQY